MVCLIILLLSLLSGMLDVLAQTDSARPAIFNITEPFVIEAGDQVNISFNASDNVQLDKVRLNITASNGTNFFFDVFNVTQSNYSGLFNSTFSLGFLNVFGFANDTSANVNNTENKTFTIVDTIAPNVTSLSPNGTQFNINDQVNISVTIMDRVGVSVVLANITWPNSSRTAFPMLQAGTLWSMLFNDTAQAGDYNFTIVANDTSNNINNTQSAVFKVVSNVSAGGGGGGATGQRLLRKSLVTPSPQPPPQETKQVAKPPQKAVQIQKKPPEEKGVVIKPTILWAKPEFVPIALLAVPFQRIVLVVLFLLTIALVLSILWKQKKEVKQETQGKII